MIEEANVETIRAVSRQLVRELGFMGGAFAGTELPPSAVHALIEIDCQPSITARDLASLLRLEKSSVSRMLRKLVVSGDVSEDNDESDSRAKALFLTKSGHRRVAEIHAFARNQVATALAHLAPGQDRTVIEGLRLYRDALAARGGGHAAPSDLAIVPGYRPGLIARITHMHAIHYARTSGFGRAFESTVAGGLAEFCDRLDDPQNAIWAAMRGDEVIGSIAIDGEDLGSDIAHLRWFIVDDGVRGGGIGRRLLSTALAFSDERRFSEAHLWTFAGLDAARHLYEAHGFACVEERLGNQWGREVVEQRFARSRP